MPLQTYPIDVPGDGRLAIAPRPRGGDWLADDLATLRAEGVDAVVSLLSPAEAAELELTGEAEICGAAGIEYRGLAIADLGTPDWAPATFAFIERLAGDVRSGRSVVVHCRQGIGRAGLES